MSRIPMPPRGAIWECKIGITSRNALPQGADLAMRVAAYNTYFRLTGNRPMFLFSGWDGRLTDDEMMILTELEQSVVRDLMKERHHGG